MRMQMIISPQSSEKGEERRKKRRHLTRDVLQQLSRSDARLEPRGRQWLAGRLGAFRPSEYMR